MLIALMIMASAPQAESLKALAALDLRVAAIGDRLARGGLCDGVLSSPGWLVQDVVQYATVLRPAARETLRLGDTPTLVAVMPGSSAAQAGLLPGDALVAIDARPIPAAASGKKAYGRLGLVDQWVEDGLKRGKLSISYRRGTDVRTAEVVAQPGCASRFQLTPGAKLNASADGTYVQVSGALVEFVRSDDELALVIAHELAHNILGHRVKLDAAGVSRGLLAPFGKNRTRIRATELEADRHALYLMARAGYDISVAPAFWERFGRKVDAGILSDGTHAGWRERVERARAEIARIEAQRRAGGPPTP